jgi:HTH-type transcriptional regulator/antitoxin HipB
LQHELINAVLSRLLNTAQIFPNGNIQAIPSDFRVNVPEREQQIRFCRYRKKYSRTGTQGDAVKYTSAQLGEMIRQTRNKMGLTQASLAMVAGTGLRFIIDLEKGKPTCQLGKTLIVMNTLGIKMTLTPPTSNSGTQRSEERNRDIE